MGYSKNPLTRKALLGNQFDIKIKNVKVSEPNLICVMEEVDDLSSRKQLPNFFGNQRFGSDRPVNHLAGKALIQGKFKYFLTIKSLERASFPAMAISPSEVMNHLYFSNHS